MKEHFINELRHLLNMIVAQGGLVESAIKRAIDAVTATDAELARHVISDDSTIDAEEIRIEEECLKILALYQPVATDLRTVVAILKINTALERMADFGAHIAERAIELAGMSETLPDERIDFTAMEQNALSMLRDSMKVMRRSDTVLAYGVIERDDAVDQARRDIVQLVARSISLHPAQAPYYLACMGISRDLERIADIATDICEHIIYLETGKIIRHRR